MVCLEKSLNQFVLARWGLTKGEFLGAVVQAVLQFLEIASPDECFEMPVHRGGPLCQILSPIDPSWPEMLLHFRQRGAIKGASQFTLLSRVNRASNVPIRG